MPVYETDADGRPVRLSNRTKSSNLIFNPKLSNMEILKKDVFMLTTDGSLYRTDKKKLVMDTNYCVEYIDTTLSEEAFHAFIIWDNETESSAMAKDKRGSWMYLISQASYVTSAVCLALTLLVYAKLSYLRNVHGYYVMCYMACELVWFVCEIINKIMIIDNILLFNPPFGVLFNYFNLFAMLTTCCWLNIICFDIYWMLRYSNSINRNTSTSVRTILYQIYCWGFSSFCVSTGYLFQHSNNQTILQISPYVGDFLCYFYDCTYLRNIIFLIMCMSVMQTANLVLFLLTASHYSRIKSQLNKFNPTDSKTESFLDYKEKFLMNIKLFLIMGMPRSSEIVPFFFQKGKIIWDIFDATVSLQGVFVFIIFVAKRKIIMDLLKNFKRSMDHSESTVLNTIPESS
ncbi:unnamed protein product [Macrosiphum euphorbiae]|nr:unnamed protein product [Macrosiphum euphorbiae]